MLSGEMLEVCIVVLIVERMGWGMAALEVESLVGDKDLARSTKVNSHTSKSRLINNEKAQLTGPSRFPLLAALNDVLFQFPRTFLVLSVSLVT